MTPRSLTMMLLFTVGLAACAPPTAMQPVATLTPAPVAASPSAPPPASPPASPPAPQTAATPASETKPVSSAAVQSAQQITAQLLGVSADDVKVLAIQPVTWSDSSLGCPEPDMVYAQVMTPGYQAQVEVEGQTHTVNMDESGYGVVCDQP